ncbi:hypothetical protein R1sor_012914 [Riccia sorocarpa]|uniref:BAG domain-containing protein n=1 Tax=Riccia sorocarpa TaxID=122646 RepID=A0ABD3I552_9MARC
MVNDRQEPSTSAAQIDPGGKEDSPQKMASTSDPDMGQKIAHAMGVTNGENFIPNDPLQQKDWLEALNTNNEMIRKIIMRQSQELSPRNKSSSGSQVIVNASTEDDPKRDVEKLPDRPSAHDHEADKGYLEAAADQREVQESEIAKNPHLWSSTFTHPSFTQENQAPGSLPREVLHQPPGTPSSSKQVQWDDLTPKGNLHLKPGDPNIQSSMEFHTTASVLKQMRSPTQGTHSSDLLHQHHGSPGPVSPVGRAGAEPKGGAHNTPSGTGQQHGPTSYAQATNPSATQPQDGAEDQHSWPSKKNREYVKAAMIQMLQLEYRADPTKVRRKTLNEEAIERVRRKLQTLEAKALVLYTEV